MSRAFTVGPRSQTKATTQGKVPSTKPQASNRGTTGTGSRHSTALQSSGRTRNNSSTTAINSNNSPASKPLKTAAASVKQNSSLVGRGESTLSKPRVVTLADLNSSGTSKTSKKSNASVHTSTASTQQSTPVKEPKTCVKRTGTKTDRTMWEQELGAAGRKTTSMQAGQRNVAGNHGNGRQGLPNNGSSPGSSRLTSDGQSQGGQAERKATYQPQGGYTLISPDQKKRDKLQNQRSAELARLDKYKEKKKVGHVSMQPSKVGGYGKSEEETRRQQERELKTKKYDMLRKKEQWAEEKKKREEEEYAEKKARARQQAERNKQREEERQRELQADRQAWLRQGGLDTLGDGQRRGMSERGDDGKIDEGAVEALMEIYPLKSRQKLVEMLTAASGDVNKVIDWLSD